MTLHETQSIDLNLLTAAHALLTERSVTRAAARLHLSVPAASRTLDRCRRAFGDELLVRSGRSLVATPRGEELLGRVGPLLAQLDAVLRPVAAFDPAHQRRRVVVRANEAVVSALGGALAALVGAEAPHVELRFEAESADDLDAVRAGDVTLAIGSYGDVTGDLRTAHLADERLVGVLRAGHPMAGRRMTVTRFASLGHVVTSRRGRARGPVDQQLRALGRTRPVAAVVPSFAAALALCLTSDLTTLAPTRLASAFASAGGWALYEAPVVLPPVRVVLVWHGRFDGDPAHAWLRDLVRRAAVGR